MFGKIFYKKDQRMESRRAILIKLFLTYRHKKITSHRTNILSFIKNGSTDKIKKITLLSIKRILQEK